MIKCPQCGHENVPGTQFCEGCGEELPSANAAPSAAPVSGGDMIQCPACDNMNPAENVACEVCGAELPRPTGATPPPVAPPAAATPAAAPMPMPPAPPAPVSPSMPINDPASTTSAASPVAPTTPMPPADPAPDFSASIPPDAPPSPPMPAATPSGGDLAPGKVKLVVEQGQTVGAQFVLGDPEMLVGREDTEEDIYPDIDLSDQDAGYVHRRHATLRFENGALTVTHLGGMNKTRVNNKPIPDDVPQSVKLGDKIAFGKVVLRVLPA